MLPPILVALLFAAGVAASAEEAPSAPKGPAPEAAAEAAVKDIEVCLDNLRYFRADLLKKETELEAEFKGKVPSAFVFLLNMKRGRVTRQQEDCGKLIKLGAAPFVPVEAELQALEGGSDAYTKKKKKLDELRARMNKAFRGFATPDK